MSERQMHEALRSRISLFGPSRGTGRVFYVNGYGGQGVDAVNRGRTPQQPFSTITYALTQCTDYLDDVIIVLNYWQPAGEAWPIVVNVQNVHIFGLNQPNMGWPVIHPPAPGTVAAFAVGSNGQNSEIAGFVIGGGTVGGGISVGANATADGVWIHDCQFGHRWFGTPVAGILQLNAYGHGAERLRIEKCKFWGDEANFNGAITGNGISIEKVADFFGIEIIDCIFSGLAIGINLVQGINGEIRGNRFAVDDAGGLAKAITLGAGCEGVLVDDNHSMSRMATGSTSNPWSDLAGGVVNKWGLNTTGGAYQAAI